MSVQLEETKRMAAKLQKECEEYLVVIVQQRQEANDQAKQISAKSEKIEAEENEVKQEGILLPSMWKMKCNIFFQLLLPKRLWTKLCQH